MFVEGTLRWQVTEDCPWDLLMALAVRELAGLDGSGEPRLPGLVPSPVAAVRAGTAGPRSPRRTAPAVRTPPSAASGESPRREELLRQWRAWFDAAVDREHRPLAGLLQPPHFPAFDRAIELQDVIIAHYERAAIWATDRRADYARMSAQHHARRAADIVDVVHEREHELRRQAGYFRLDLDVLPLAEPGAWIVGPHTVVISESLRDDSRAFREWFRPLVAAMV